ncbi:MAG TPA: MBL fold metallo-hydrolase [Candidatus Limnocylindrales bacterium]|nr:MBL fold metallo-hydrolase [Candidatus Limnocylindrales bacterium]
MSTPKPAATVVLLRPGAEGLEVLLTHRPPSMAFAPNVHVFPGGRVDEADLGPAVQARSVVTPQVASDALGGDLPPVDALGAYIAAIREAFEEVGILLADAADVADLADARQRLLRSASAWPSIVEELDLRLRTDLLVPLSRWVTPPTLPRRFDTRFFAAAAPNGIEVSLLGEEVAAHAWYRPRAALDTMALGDLDMWLPTSTTLMQLAFVGSIDDIGECLAPGPLGDVEVEDIATDIVRIRMPAGGGVAGQPVDAYLVGRERLVLIDPGDPTGPGLDRALEEAARRGGTIEAIALTCAEPDHAGGAEALREQLGIEVSVGPSGGRSLPYVVNEVDDGTAIDAGDVPLRVVATPGLEPEALAFVVGEGQYAVTGDLDGERGARSIFGPVDTDAWQDSVARLSTVAPDAIWLAGHPRVDSGP